MPITPQTTRQDLELARQPTTIRNMNSQLLPLEYLDQIEILYYK